MKIYNIKKLLLIVFVPFFAFAIGGQDATANRYSKTNRAATGQYVDRILFVEDENKKEFVIKKQTNSEGAIHEAVCAEILERSGINTNHVEIFPAGHSPIKDFDSFVTTVHSLAPGEEIAKIEDMQDFSIGLGLSSKSTLKSIIKYECGDLVAANIYLDDGDSHGYNNFFDKETNQFCTIDKGHAFLSLREVPNDSDASLSLREDPDAHSYRWYVSATRTHRFLANLKKEELSLPQIQALAKVNNKLQEIMIEYPPAAIQEKLIETAEKIHYRYAPEKQEYMGRFLQHNFDENCEVVMQLDRLTGPYASNKLFLDNFCHKLQKKVA